MKRFKPVKHTVETLTEALQKKGVDYLTVVGIDYPFAVVKDSTYGEFRIDLKSFCNSMTLPLHKNRRHAIKMEKATTKYVGKTIKGVKILGLFYGPDRGYKNRSFYVEFLAKCGHVCITTMALINNHSASENLCLDCGRVTHGARVKVDGVRIKRTPTYLHWLKIKNTLPESIKDFTIFKQLAGDKPAPGAELVIGDDGIPRWLGPAISEDKEIKLIAGAVRQAFRYSNIYKQCLANAKVEGADTAYYKCATCGELSKLNKVQVDHIDPIVPIDGSPLLKEDIIKRVWTDNIQVLDNVCHSKKSAEENKLRKENRLKNKKKRGNSE